MKLRPDVDPPSYSVLLQMCHDQTRCIEAMEAALAAADEMGVALDRLDHYAHGVNEGGETPTPSEWGGAWDEGKLVLDAYKTARAAMRDQSDTVPPKGDDDDE